MPSAADLRRRAAHCLRVAAAVENQAMAAHLVALAADFSAQADEIDPSLREGGTSAGSSRTAGDQRR